MLKDRGSFGGVNYGCNLAIGIVEEKDVVVGEGWKTMNLHKTEGV
jgi:hypothetical protein